MSSNKNYRPESLMMSYGYKPELSEGAVKCPIFQTSTFVFKTAEEGKAHFETAYGLIEEKREAGLIYSRLNNPNLEILENRLTLWDKTEACAVFESGMAAISTTLLEFLEPGAWLLYSNPLYGGSTHFIEHILPKYGVNIMPFKVGETNEEITAKLDTAGVKPGDLTMIYIETPANPTNDLIDIEACSRLAKQFSTAEKQTLLTVDNTYMGPLWQHPIQHGADLVLYSATKYIGGHSDVIAGACLGSEELIQRIKVMRTFLGNMASPNTAWLLLRSLETLQIRMERQTRNAQKVADFLLNHPKVEKTYYLGHLTDARQQIIFEKQCLSPGAMLAFDIKGGEKEAFQFLNNLKLVKLAVSLGGTESLAEHPASMTHAGSDKAHKDALSITDKMIRLSVGVEHYEDLIDDMTHAFECVGVFSEAML